MKRYKRKQDYKGEQSYKVNIYIFKWIMFVILFLILGGVLSFVLLLISVNLIEGPNTLRPIWIVSMIPTMTCVAIPIFMIVYKQITKQLSVLLKGMDRVAGGDLETYIPTANAKDFARVYDNFNKMVAEIQKAEALRTSVFDSLSHELKTPIASINGFARVLIEKDLPQEKQQKYVRIIYDESECLENLIKNILLISKLDSLEIISNKEEYSLTRQLQDCVISLENQWGAKNIEISAQLEECLYVGEAQLMKSLWLNLLSNAVKFTPEEGSIGIDLKRGAGGVVVTISDTGIGMSAETQKHIFESHYQHDDRVSSGGQGLGLPIVKRIVKLCGGSITVKSEEGCGSVFSVTLPDCRPPRHYR